MAVRIKTSLKQEIFSLLRDYDVLRDNDNRLLANFWHSQLPDNLKKDKGVREFFQLLAIGHFTSPESILRARRQVQEANPQLRGKTYDKRQNNQSTIKQDLGYV